MRWTLLIAGLVLLWAGGMAVAWALHRAGRLRPPLHRDLLALGLLALLNAGFFWEVLFLGAHLPRGGGDLASFLYPRYAFASRALQQGTFPLWNPYLYGGQPYFADLQSGLLYPPNLLTFLLARPFSYHTLERLVMVHYWLAAVAMYLFGRRLGLGVAASLVGAVVWGWSGFLVAHLGHYNMVAVAAWLPLVLALLWPALSGGALGWAVGAAVALAVSTLAGHTQLTLYTLLALAVAGLVGGWPRARGWPAVRALGRVVLVLGLTFGLAGGLCAVQLLPSYELTRLSVRATLSYPEATAFSLLPQRIVLLLVPHFYGRDPTAYWGPPSLTENYGYVGIGPLVLALVALALRRDRATLFFALLGAGGLLLAFGDWTPLHGWLYSLGPGFDKVRAPGRFLVFVDLAVAGLAALGADRLFRGVSWRERPALRLVLWLVGGALFGALFVAGPLVYLWLFVNQRQHQDLVEQTWTATSSFVLATLFLLSAFALLLLARYRLLTRPGLMAFGLTLVVLDLFTANSRLNPTAADPTLGFQHQPVIAFLKQQSGLFRIDTVTGVEEIWQPDTALLAELPSVWGLWNPVVLADYYWYWKQHIPGRGSALYDLLNARYLLGKKDVVLDRQKFRPVFTDHPLIDVYENPQALPRAFLVGREWRAASHAEALEWLRRPDFDPRQVVIVEGASGPALPTDEGPLGEVAVEAYGLNSLVVRVRLERPGYLVLSEVYYPGWEAWVDGQPAPVLRANWLFRAILLEPGEHVVAMAFRPRSVMLGLGLSLLAGTVVLLWGVQALWRWHRARRAASALAVTAGSTG